MSHDKKPAAPAAPAPAAPVAAAAPAAPAAPVAPAPAKKNDKGKVATARILGAACAGIAEIFTFHPIDTIAKRLMSNTEKIFGTPGSGAKLNKVIFKKAANETAMKKYLSLFPGISFGVAYKLLQRVYKFGGQPYVDDILVKHYKKNFDNAFGKKWGRSMMYATAGCLIGIGEVVLLPLDVLKIKSQTNPEAFAGRGFIDIIAKENIKLYRGTVFTAARNAPGSFALFGGNAFAKEYIFHLKDYKKATFAQTCVSSTIGATFSILVSNPFDVVKTRIQNKKFSEKETGAQIVSKIMFKEGPHAFFKGVVPKLAMVGPKLVFSFTIAQWLTAYIEKSLGVEGKSHKKH